MKRLVRKAFSLVKRLEAWAQADPYAGHDFTKDDTAYPWMNYALRQVTAETYHPAYAWGVLQGVHLAKHLGVPRVSVIEFGVAGGRGLLALERIARSVETLVEVGIDVYGFDTGCGLPKPMDYRDRPNAFAEGAFPMDFTRLQQRFTMAKLILGDIRDTLPQHLASSPAPVAFISVDVDLYTSTVHTLRLFDASEERLLPRVWCYFDDIIGFTTGDCNGELLAIADFNAAHTTRKLSPMYGLKHFVKGHHREEPWVEMFYLLHLFDHSQYGCHDGFSRRQSLDLTG